MLRINSLSNLEHFKCLHNVYLTQTMLITFNYAQFIIHKTKAVGKNLESILLMCFLRNFLTQKHENLNGMKHFLYNFKRRKK